MALGSGRYLVGEVLGRGGAATVYRGLDTKLQVERAIKVLSAARQTDRIARVRFLNEARTMAALHHPGIVPVHDVIDEPEGAVMVMELVDGWSLADRVQGRGPLAPREAAWVVSEVLLALHAAHEAAVVHRDVKPQNILLTAAGVPKLTDFGIARNADIDTITRPGASVGTDGYMAPEQREDAALVGPQADVYAAGATLWFVLTGEPPGDLFDPQTHARLAAVPRELAAIITKATRREPAHRYGSALEMALALQDATVDLRSGGIGAPPIGLPRARPEVIDWKQLHTLLPPPKVAPKPRNRARVLAVVGVVALSFVGAVAAAALIVRLPADDGGVAAAAPVQLEQLPQETGTGILHAEPAAPAAAPAPAAPAPRTAPASAAPGGTLFVNSLPWSRVFVDGVEVGNTAWSGPVPGGTHTIRLVAGDGREYQGTVRIGAGDTRLCWDFQLDGACL